MNRALLFKSYSIILTATILLACSSPAHSHGNEDHNSKEDPQSEEKNSNVNNDGWEVISEEPDPKILSKINSVYMNKIEPIFQKKCLDCHGSPKILPWYSKLPGAKQLIQYDMKEAKKHMDMSEGFPFKGHGSPKDDLKELKRTMNKDSMPLFRYKLLHWGSTLTDIEKSQINNWIDKSLKKLSKDK